MSEIVPFDAKVFFSELGKWEMVCSLKNPDCERLHPYATINLETGKLTYPDNWGGMRKKKQLRGYWINLYENGAGNTYKTEAEALDWASRSKGTCIKTVHVEWKIKS